MNISGNLKSFSNFLLFMKVINIKNKSDKYAFWG
jgi:hypothetical protein